MLFSSDFSSAGFLQSVNSCICLNKLTCRDPRWRPNVLSVLQSRRDAADDPAPPLHVSELISDSCSIKLKKEQVAQTWKQFVAF